jgi:flavin prenyltransferase
MIPVRFSEMHLTLAITGASGAIYGFRTLLHLAASGAVERINLILSDSARMVAKHELNLDLSSNELEKIIRWSGIEIKSDLIEIHNIKNIAARPASGSYTQAGMIIAPCSMGTIGAISSGAVMNLIHRAADVTLKEGRKLVLVPRETPYNTLHLENMLRLSRAGARIVPASPGFYHLPQSITELVDHLVYRLLDQFGIPHTQATSWKGLPHDRS